MNTRDVLSKVQTERQRRQSAEEISAFVAEHCTAAGRDVFDISESAEAGLDRALAVTLINAARDLSLKIESLTLLLRAPHQETKEVQELREKSKGAQQGHGFYEPGFLP